MTAPKTPMASDRDQCKPLSLLKYRWPIRYDADEDALYDGAGFPIDTGREPSAQVLVRFANTLVFNMTAGQALGLAEGTHVVVAKDELQRQYKAGYECGGNGA